MLYELTRRGADKCGSSRQAHAWSELRDAVAAEFISSLPPSMDIGQVAFLLGRSESEVEGMIALGKLTVHGRYPRQFIIPAENFALLRQEMLLRLPLEGGL